MHVNVNCDKCATLSRSSNSYKIWGGMVLPFRGSGTFKKLVGSRMTQQRRRGEENRGSPLANFNVDVIECRQLLYWGAKIIFGAF